MVGFTTTSNVVKTCSCITGYTSFEKKFTVLVPQFEPGATEVPMEPRLLEGADELANAHGGIATCCMTTSVPAGRIFANLVPAFEPETIGIPMEPRLLEGADELTAPHGETTIEPS